MAFYFAYGSNLWRDQMGERCPGSRVLGMGVLKGYRWIITARGYASIVESKNDDVYGTVYEMSETDERALDLCEGVAEGKYYKAFKRVLLGRSKLECLVYIDNETREGSPKTEYITRINRGLQDAQLPATYVRINIRRYIPAEQ